MKMPLVAVWLLELVSQRGSKYQLFFRFTQLFENAIMEERSDLLKKPSYQKSQPAISAACTTEMLLVIIRLHLHFFDSPGISGYFLDKVFIVPDGFLMTLARAVFLESYH